MKIKTFEGGYDKNFCYVVWCEDTKIAAIVDPSVEINPIIEFIDSKGLIVDKILITHSHFDHIRYTDDFLDLYPSVSVHASSRCRLDYDINYLEHNDILTIGKEIVIAQHTPGHYYDSICYWSKDHGCVFTGDTIFVGRTGRTISQGSCIEDLYKSVYSIFLDLPPSTIIYPGHNYGFSKTISIKDNVNLSKFFQCKSIEEFKIVMKNFEKNRKNN